MTEESKTYKCNKDEWVPTDPELEKLMSKITPPDTITVHWKSFSDQLEAIEQRLYALECRIDCMSVMPEPPIKLQLEVVTNDQHCFNLPEHDIFGREAHYKKIDKSTLLIFLNSCPQAINEDVHFDIGIGEKTNKPFFCYRNSFHPLTVGDRINIWFNHIQEQS